MSNRARMGEFWDRRARENALYFVDNTVDYRSPDSERFWAEGERAVSVILDTLGVAVRPTDDVVEIGCGVGRLTRALAARAASVRALDVSPEMLARAQEANADLANVEWIRGDGTSLTGIADASAEVCFSHVVFQHIPEPAITLGYVREMGRVLRPGGWAGFQISNDPGIHRRRGWGERLKRRALSLAGRAPRGMDDPEWLGSAVELDDLREAGDAAGLELERAANEGTQFCLVLLRRR